MSWFKRRHLSTSLIEIGLAGGTLPPKNTPVVQILKVTAVQLQTASIHQLDLGVVKPLNKDYMLMLVQTQCHSHDTICIFLNIVLSGEEKFLKKARGHEVHLKCPHGF